MHFLLSLLSTLFASLFRKSEAERLGAAEEKLRVYEAAQKTCEETKKIKAPNTNDELDKLLRSGKLCFAIMLPLILLGCTSVTVPYCQDVLSWSRSDQIQIATDLRRLPSTSPVRAAIADYAKMREEARVCNRIGGEYYGDAGHE